MKRSNSAVKTQSESNIKHFKGSKSLPENKPDAKKTRKNYLKRNSWIPEISKDIFEKYIDHITKPSSTPCWKTNPKILCSDFWSVKMKHQLRNIDSIDDFKNSESSTNAKKSSETFPILEEKFKRSSFLNPNINTPKIIKVSYTSAIDKIINDCKAARVATKKLSSEIFYSKNSIKKDFNLILRPLNN
jgi:hypothetical protein